SPRRNAGAEVSPASAVGCDWLRLSEPCAVIGQKPRGRAEVFAGIEAEVFVRLVLVACQARATMDTTELIRYVDDLMRRAIASDLKIRRKDLVSSPELQERVEHFLITVKAISATPTNDDAVDALVGLVKKPASRASLAADVTTAYEKLYLEIAGFERLLEMLKLKMGPAVIWDFLR